MSIQPVLPTRLVEKVWGRSTLPSPFSGPDGKQIGEIWFEPQPGFDRLLAKYLFTSEKLSVQVHPSDHDAPDGQRGKEECWLVLDAEEDARLAIGFRQSLSKDEMRAAAVNGSIEDLLEWYPAQRGDFFYLPAGTVHAIGPGISLVEIQQNSDLTYRLFDYGRPRKLHLEEALAVANGQPHEPRFRRKIDFDKSASLVEGPYFRLDYLVGRPAADFELRFPGPVMAMPLIGDVLIGNTRIGAGECGVLHTISEAMFADHGATLIAQPVG